MIRRRDAEAREAFLMVFSAISAPLRRNRDRPLAHRPQLRMDDALVFGAEALHVGPQALLNFGRGALQFRLRMPCAASSSIRARWFPWWRTRCCAAPCRSATLRRNWISFWASLRSHSAAPFRPVIAEVVEPRRVGGAQRGGGAIAQLHQRAVIFAERFDGGVEAGDGLAVELHLLAHVPIEHARHQALPRLHQRVDRTAAARIHRADSRDFAQRGIARMHQRHQIGQRNVGCARVVFRMLRADAVAHRLQHGDQFSAFHETLSGVGPTRRDQRAQSAARSQIADHRALQWVWRPSPHPAECGSPRSPERCPRLR